MENYAFLNKKADELSLSPFDRSKILAAAVALVAVYKSPIPSSEVGSAQTHYRTTISHVINDLISTLGESAVLDYRFAKELAEALWLVRYNCAYNPQFPFATAEDGIFDTIFGVSRYVAKDVHSFMNENKRSILALALPLYNCITALQAESTGESQAVLYTDTISSEGFTGGVLGFILGVPGYIPGVSAGAHGAAKAVRLKLREDIKTIAVRIAKVRNGDLEEAKKEGKKVPGGLKKVEYLSIIKSAVIGTFLSPIYGAYQGSDIQNLNKELKAKIKELEVELEAAGISTENIVVTLEETESAPASGSTASGAGEAQEGGEGAGGEGGAASTASAPPAEPTPASSSTASAPAK